MSVAAASKPMSADELLKQDWMLLGRSAGYEAPSKQESRDLADPRNRMRGKKAQRARLKRNRQLLDRERMADRRALPGKAAMKAAVPQYLLDRGVPATHTVHTLQPTCLSNSSDEWTMKRVGAS